MRVGDAKALNGGEAKQKQEKADGKAQIARCCREQQQAVAVEQGGADEGRGSTPEKAVMMRMGEPT